MEEIVAYTAIGMLLFIGFKVLDQLPTKGFITRSRLLALTLWSGL